MSRLAVLLGHGIGYSASPAMHNAAFAELGIDARYELRDVAEDALAREVDALRANGRIGANVTKPHKIAVCELVDDLGPEVARLGAANTIVRLEGRLMARNTDLAALGSELFELPRLPSRAVVLGAGGASRAAVVALSDLGCPMIDVIGRDRWPELPDALGGADLVINATPIGTASGETPVPRELLTPDLMVLDLVYRPSPSRLVREARRAGAAARGGSGMLLRQAAASFGLWTGREAPTEAMRRALRTELGDGIDA